MTSRSLSSIINEVDKLINQPVFLDTHIVQTKIAGYNVGYNHGKTNQDPAYISNNSFPENGIYYTRQLWYNRKTRSVSLAEPKSKEFGLKRAVGKQKNELYAFEVELKHRRVSKIKIIKLNKLDNTAIGLLLNVHKEQKVKQWHKYYRNK